MGRLVAGQWVKVLGEEDGQPVSGNTTWYRIDGGRFAGARIHSSLIRPIAPPTPNTTPPDPVPASQTWITVDRKHSTLTLVQEGQPTFTTYVSLGRAGVSTPSGQYSTFGKYRADDMTSASVADADHSYDLPNVPFTQYFRLGGFAIHGTYWHDGFGGAESQGCVNLTIADAAYLFEVTKPVVAPEDNARWSAAEAATTVVILD
ncbi:MAG: L,D-transpeptidase [Chloroflexi bacterium]|nr:L,D-transpeptidase [Chloroflexota bacterium]